MFFRSETLEYCFEFLQAMFGFGERAKDGYVFMFLTTKLTLILVIGIVLSGSRTFKNTFNKLVQSPARAGQEISLAIGVMRDIVLLSLLVLSAMFVTAQTYNPFIYFRF